MKPISAFYFIKHNKRRSIALIFMIAITAIVYLGALYITSPRTHNQRVYRPYQDYAPIYLDYPSTQEDYDTYKSMILSLSSVKTLLPFTTSYSIINTNEMMIDNPIETIVLTNEEDMKTFMASVPALQNAKIVPKDGDIIISSSLAKNAKIHLDDTINASDMSDFTFHVVDIIECSDYFAYAVNTHANAYSALILRKGSKEEFTTDLSTLPSNYNGISLHTYEAMTETANNDLEIFNLIFYISLFLITAVLVITINATFVATYEKRTHEFSIYEALGFHKSEIIGKLVREIVLMDLIGLVIAISISLFVLFVINHQVLYPQGLGLNYVNGLSLTSILISNASIVLLNLLFRIRWYLRIKPIA